MLRFFSGGVAAHDAVQRRIQSLDFHGPPQSSQGTFLALSCHWHGALAWLLHCDALSLAALALLRQWHGIALAVLGNFETVLAVITKALLLVTTQTWC